MWLLYCAFSIIIGIHSTSSRGYQLSRDILKLNNEIYYKSSNTNTLYSPKLTCIDTIDYTIDENNIHLGELRNSLTKFHGTKVFQKPIFNVLTKQLEDFEIIYDTDNLLVYGPHINLVMDICNYTVILN
jgi:hypothetical protein